MSSQNPFINSNTNNPFQTQNPFLQKEDKNQQKQITSFFPNNIFSNSNLNQEQKAQGINNQILNSSNIFNNMKTSIAAQNSQNNKIQETNSFNSFLNSNQNQNNNIFTKSNIINNKEENKNSIINININTNNINKNISNNDVSNDFFNINSKKKSPFQSNIISTKNEEKKEENNNIFLAQSNNFLNKLNNDANANAEKDNKTHLNFENENNSNKDQTKSLFEGLSKNKDKSNEKKEDKKVEEFIQNLLAEEKLVYSNKEILEYLKNQTLNQLSGEIINDLKDSLISQKNTFTECIKNTRLAEEEYYEICKKANIQADISVQNEIRYSQLLLELKSVYQKSNLLEQKINGRNKDISEALDYLLKNNNTNNNFNFNYIKRIDFEENNSFYKDLKETSSKVRKIEDDLNIINNNIEKNQKYEYDRENILYEKFNENNGKNNEILSFSNYMEGVWIERNNSQNKIYVEQKEMNELLNDCYSGLYGLMAEQEDIEKRCEKLKNKLIDKINKHNNNSLGNNIDNSNNINNINASNINNFNIDLKTNN